MTAPELVVAYNFAPYADASAITTLKRIVARGVPVDVVSNRLGAVRSTDESLVPLVSPLIRKHVVLDEVVSFSRWESIRSFTTSGLGAVRRLGSHHQRVYSRSMWAHSHFLAAAMKVVGLAPTWVAEFSDPLRRTVDGGLRASEKVPLDELAGLYLAAVPRVVRETMKAETEVFDWAEILPLALADVVVFTNDNQREVVLDGITSPWLRSRLRERSQIAPHPSIRWDLEGLGEDVGFGRVEGAFHLGYFGTFYANRGLGALLEAMAHIRQAGDRIILDVYGERSAELERAAGAAGVRDCLRIRDRVPYVAACILQRQYDALVTNDVVAPAFGGRQPFLPSKLSDYLAADVPVLALVEPGSPTAQLELDHAVDIGDLRSLVDVLRRLVSDRRVMTQDGRSLVRRP